MTYPCDICQRRSTHHMCDFHAQADLQERLTTLTDALQDLAEGDCHYGDNCPSNAGTRHGTCDACKARYALERAGIPLRSYVEDVP